MFQPEKNVMTLSKSLKKKFKALMIDVDGTLIVNKENGIPTPRVKKAIAKASKKIHIGIATSRPIFQLKHIFEHLSLSGPSIINGGAQVIDATSKQPFYRQPMEKKDLKKIYELATKYHTAFYADTDNENFLLTHQVPKGDILGLFIPQIDFEFAKRFRKEIEMIPTVSAHLMPSWLGGTTLSVFHARSTKQRGILEVAKLLGINTHEIIGVGDGYNDFPLLMACGLKVAMGNAADDLKAIADYIAPSVEEDGVADVIERFVLD